MRRFCTSVAPWQLTLAILKPDCVKVPRARQGMRDAMVANGFLVLCWKRVFLSREQASAFYAEHEGKFFHGRLVSYMSSGPIEPYVLARPDAIAHWRKLLGPTKVFKTIHSDPEALRGQFGLTDTRNVVHGSDSEASAEREVNFFFPDFDWAAWRRFQESVTSSMPVATFDEKEFVHVLG